MQEFSSFIDNLKTLVSFNTEKTSPLPNAPFGAETAKALDCFLSIAKDMGFKTTNYDNYIGEVTIGEGEEIGIIGHLDVVPSGEGWNTPPFTLTEIEGNYFARGVEDNKSPLLLCLYALKELKDSGKPINRKFRLFAGCNEEDGWQDVAYFKEHYSFPEYGFSPDGNFPLTYAEKGMYEIIFSIPTLKRFRKVKGGTVVNAVLANASAVADDVVIDKSLLDEYGLFLDGNVIKSVGKAAHGSKPHLGKNALIALFSFFIDSGEDDKLLSRALEYILLDKKDIGQFNNEQGRVTLSAGLIEEKDGEIIITCDCRIPAPLSLSDITPFFDTFGIPYKVKERHEPMMVEKDGWLVSSLLSAYNEVTGESAQPISMGGCTFARAFKKGCSFGPSLHNANHNIHTANEFINREELLKIYDIYKLAIFKLAEK